MNSMLLYILVMVDIANEFYLKIVMCCIRFGNFLSSRGIVYFFILYARVHTLLFKTQQSTMEASNIKKITGSNIHRRNMAFYRRMQRHIVMLLFFGNKCLEKDIMHCAQILSTHAGQDRPVVFMPLHILNDNLAGVTATLAAGKNNYVVVTNSDDRVKLQQLPWYKTHLADRFHTINVETDRRDALPRAIKEVRNKQACLTIFPDILPEYTARLVSRPQPKEQAVIFGRPALRHAGPAKIAGLTDAQVVPFYIYWHRGHLKIKVMPAMKAVDGLLDLDRVIEEALREKPEQWMLWHFSSFFYFNP